MKRKNKNRDEPPHQKTNNLPMRKQRPRSAVQSSATSIQSFWRSPVTV